MKRIVVLLLLALLMLSIAACEQGPYEIEVGGEIIFRDEGVRGEDEDDLGASGSIFPSDGVDLPSVRPGAQ